MQASQLKELLHCDGKQGCIGYKQANQKFESLMKDIHNLLVANSRLENENKELKERLERFA